MSIMHGKLFEVLVKVGAPEDLAMAAATESADSMKTSNDLSVKMEKVLGELAIIKWMLGIQVGLALVILIRFW